LKDDFWKNSNKQHSVLRHSQTLADTLRHSQTLADTRSQTLAQLLVRRHTLRHSQTLADKKMSYPLCRLTGSYTGLHPAVERALKCLEGNYKNLTDISIANSLSTYLHNPGIPLFGSHENAWGDLMNMLSNEDQDALKKIRTTIVLGRGMKCGDDALTYGLPLSVFPFEQAIKSLEEQEVEEWHEIEVYGDALDAFTAKDPQAFAHRNDLSEYETLNKLEEEHNRDILRCGWDEGENGWNFMFSGGWWFENISNTLPHLGGQNYIWRFIQPGSFEGQRFPQLQRRDGLFMEETLDDQEKIVTNGVVSKKGPNYMVASTKYGDCYIPLKFTRYVGEIGEHIKLLARFKDLSYACPLLCAKVLKGSRVEPGHM